MEKLLRLALLLITSVAALLASTDAANVLLQGYKLVGGSQLTQGPYALPMQYDCNLVLYHSGVAIWASNTQGRATGCYLIMQNDGNAVIYNGGGTSALWATGTYGRNDGAHYLILQDDGNFVMYNAGGVPIWASGTNGKKTMAATNVSAADALRILQSSSSAGVAATPEDEVNAALARSLHN